MRALATYIMRGRMQATLAVVGFMGLALLFPMLSYISGAAVGLVALRQGWREAGFVSAAGLAAIAAVAWIALQQPSAGLLFACIVWLPVLALALVLRTTSSWSITLNVAVGFGVAGVALFYAFVADPAAWWRDTVVAAIQEQVIDRAGLTAEQASSWRDTLDQMANVMTGIIGAAFVFSAVLSLLLARWWQAQLYNPGGFRSEFHQLRLGRPLAIVVLVLMTVSLLPWGSVGALGRDMVMVVLLMYMLQGLAVVHAVVAKRGASTAWLVATYVLLVIALPQVAMLLAIAGLMDTWLNLRREARA